jgi:SAM-dependent methyltransferase
MGDAAARAVAGQPAAITAQPAHVLVHRDQRARWDDVARGMCDLYPAASTQYYRRCEISLIHRCFGALDGKKVLKLDLWNEGFNTRILQWMHEQGARAFGIDSSAVITAAALRRSPVSNGTLHVLQSDARHIPFRAASFDFVYTIGTIEHFDEYETALREIARVLRPGGRAIIGVPHKWNIFLRPLLVSILDRFGKYPYSPEKSFSAGELRRSIERCGLRAGDRTGLLAIPGLLRMADLFCHRRGIRLQPLTTALLWPFGVAEARFTWARRLGYLLVLVAEKPLA